MSKRVCLCGTAIARDNASDECSICIRLRLDAEKLNDQRALGLLKARQVAYVYAHPEEHPTNELYLRALTAVLDEMCDALRLPKLPRTSRKIRPLTGPMPAMQDAVAVLTLLVNQRFADAIALIQDHEATEYLALSLAMVGHVVVGMVDEDPESLMARVGQAVAEIEVGV